MLLFESLHFELESQYAQCLHLACLSKRIWNANHVEIDSGAVFCIIAMYETKRTKS